MESAAPTTIPKSELLVPFIRSCRKESDQPIEGITKGKIPEWLKGDLLRVGSGLLEVGQDKYNHVFDGMALIHKFSIKDGKATYRNRFLRSEAYKKNMAANRIVTSEFGTYATPDPCKTIFQRMFSFFNKKEFTDNDLVNIVKFSNEYYAVTESCHVWRFDPENLESLKKADLHDFVPVRTAIAHTHEGRDGTVYNVGLNGEGRQGYSIMKFPPKAAGEDKDSSVFGKGSIVSRIPNYRSMNPCYFHSFGMSENYFIFLEQPLYLSLLKIAASNLTWSSYADCLHWKSQDKGRLYVVRRDTGSIVPIHFSTDALFAFHHINAYEEDDQLVVDICCYKDGSIIQNLFAKSIRENPEKIIFESQGKRFVLPLKISEDSKEPEKNLVKMPGTEAKAFLQKDGSVHCVPELHEKSGLWFSELPRINYKYNGLKYQYYYGIARNKENPSDECLLKVNVSDGSYLSWTDQDVVPSEPIFVASENATEEDDGVIVASLLYRTDDRKVSLVVLDAKTMSELARADFATESSVPATFHGAFASAQ